MLAKPTFYIVLIVGCIRGLLGSLADEPVNSADVKITFASPLLTPTRYKPPMNVPVLPLATKAPRPTLASFSALPKVISFPELVRRVGEPDEDIGSGVYIFIYHLADGSKVSVYTVDGKNIGDISHIVGTVSTRLYPLDN